jgi:hypothetical protein
MPRLARFASAMAAVGSLKRRFARAFGPALPRQRFG